MKNKKLIKLRYFKIDIQGTEPNHSERMKYYNIVEWQIICYMLVIFNQIN